MSEPNVYAEVERALIWGHSREEAYALMETSGVSGLLADEIYRRALAERIAMIRAEASGKVVKGVLLFIAGLALLCVFIFGFHFIMGKLFVLFLLLMAWGAWWVLDGAVNWIFAAGKRGSLV